MRKSSIPRLITGAPLIWSVTGASIIATSIYLAFSGRAFYFLLLLGLTLVLGSAHSVITRQRVLLSRQGLLVYVAFAAAGILFDLLFGVWLTGLWSYPNYGVKDYIWLYIAVYPLGGFVMIYTLLVGQTCWGHRIGNVMDGNVAPQPVVAPVLLTGASITAVGVAVLTGPWRPVLLLTTLVLGALLLSVAIARALGGGLVLDRIALRPWPLSMIVVSGSLVQGLVHEIPNVWASEWIYQGWPLGHVQIFGVPLLVLILGWPALMLVPAVIWDLIALMRPHRHPRT